MKKRPIDSGTDFSPSKLQRPMWVILQLLLDRLYDNHASRSWAVGWHARDKQRLISVWLQHGPLDAADSSTLKDIPWVGNSWTTRRGEIDVIDGCRINEPFLYKSVLHLIRLLQLKIPSAALARAGKTTKHVIWKVRQNPKQCPPSSSLN